MNLRALGLNPTGQTQPGEFCLSRSAHSLPGDVKKAAISGAVFNTTHVCRARGGEYQMPEVLRAAKRQHCFPSCTSQHLFTSALGIR